jgi:hypothetical protein
MTAEYPDGNILQLVVLHFEAIAVGGTLKVSDESTDAGYFTQDDVEDLSMSQLEKRRALDGFSQYVDAIICDDFVSFSEKD